MSTWSGILLCSVYRSSKKDGMYLYVPKADGLRNIPPALLDIFGAPLHVMDMPLKPGRDLARISGEQLRTEITEKGFHLQMPPPKEDYLLDLYNPDDSKYRDLP
ncbi:MAG: YcgL domain-containing protein [Moraxellaceae bacterium]|nr:YcgL domain-containing protein [Moraxellaceae bacterium]